MLDKRPFYSQKPSPLAPVDQGVDCSRSGYLAWVWAGKLVSRVRAWRMLVGEGGWDNFPITLAKSEALDLIGASFRGGKRPSMADTNWHIMYKWNGKNEFIHASSSQNAFIRAKINKFWKSKIKLYRRLKHG